MRIACLPWYELPETRTAQDALWSVLARHLRSAGVSGVPNRLSRDVTIPAVLTNPELLIGQCCGYDLVYGFASSVRMVATPCYNASGCEGSNYSSFILVREGFQAASLADLRGTICAINGFNSNSGTNALRGLVAPLSQNGRFFSEVRVSGGHTNSLALLKAGDADVMAMDCIVHALLARHRRQALAGTRVLGRSHAVPAPPIITSATADRDLHEALIRGVAAAMADEASAEAREVMLLDRVEQVPLADYAGIIDVEGAALRYGYKELHATSPAVIDPPVLAASG